MTAGGTTANPTAGTVIADSRLLQEGLYHVTLTLSQDTNNASYKIQRVAPDGATAILPKFWITGNECIYVPVTLVM